MKYYLGLDMGTTGVKAAVFTPDGVMAGAGLAEYTLETPSPDIVELETEQYWSSAKKRSPKPSKKPGSARKRSSRSRLPVRRRL